MKAALYKKCHKVSREAVSRDGRTKWERQIHGELQRRISIFSDEYVRGTATVLNFADLSPTLVCAAADGVISSTK